MRFLQALNQGLLKDGMVLTMDHFSAQKALKGRSRCFPDMGSLIFHKKNQKTIVLLAGPDSQDPDFVVKEV